jgi:5-methylcytosine-specific restriction endonuclease McrA
MVKLKTRICNKCRKPYIPTAYGQKFCGVQTTIGTCSYLNNQELHKKYLSKNKAKTSKYSKKWWSAFKKTDKYQEYLDKRKTIYLKIRFQIFARDNFTCQYCGRKAPNVILQIDHVHPKSKGGQNKLENFKTACVECNLGKTDILLSNFKSGTK